MIDIYITIQILIRRWEIGLPLLKKFLQKNCFSEVWDNQFIKTKKTFIKNIKISIEELYQKQWKNFLYFETVNSETGNKL